MSYKLNYEIIYDEVAGCY